MAEVDGEMRQRVTEEEVDLFVSVKEMREFVKSELPAETVFFSVIMCVMAAERLANNRRTRATLFDGFTQRHFKGYSHKLEKMDIFRKDARVIKVTVWDPKNWTIGNPRFRVGVVYEMKTIHGVKFYHDILLGSVQFVGPGNPGLIEEFGDFDAAKRARLKNGEDGQHRQNDGDEEKGGEDEDEEDMA